jgi:predicted DNA-binding transcriptional regulator YafY
MAHGSPTRLSAEPLSDEATENLGAVEIDYVNWKGERACRRILPQSLYLGDVEWHPGRQWILDAWDLDKDAIRSFSMAGIRGWHPIANAPTTLVAYAE